MKKKYGEFRPQRSSGNRSQWSVGIASLGLLSLMSSLVLGAPVAIAAPEESASVEVEGEEAPQISPFATLAEEESSGQESAVEASQSGDTEIPSENNAPEEEGLEGEDLEEEDTPSVVMGAARNLEITPAVEMTRCNIPAGKYGGSFAASGRIRLGGENRYATSVGIAQKVASSPQGSGSAVFVASGANFADGLSLGALAAKTGWPLLLVKPNSISAGVKSLVQKQKPTHIYIAGGTGAVSSKVEAELKALGAPNVTVVRLGGKDRYETSAKIASCFDQGAPAFVTTGVNFADAVVAGAPAAKLGGAVILTPTGKINGAAKSALASVKSQAVYLIGGTWSSAQQSAAKSAAKASSITVVSGKDRYATSAAVANKFFGTGKKPVVYATGLNFPDALSGISVAKVAGAPIVLTKTSCRPPEIVKVTDSTTAIILLGGASILANTATTTTCQPKPQPAPKPTGEKWIDINLSKFTVTAYQGSTVIMQSPMVPGATKTPTVTGTFYVWSKVPLQTMRGTNVDGSSYVTPNVPWILYFHKGYATHGAYWRTKFGYHAGANGSHGCVNMPVNAAKALYDWANVGTKVVSHY